MKWSKLKQRIEDLICDSLKGRVEFHSTRYRGTHDQEGKGWITVDKKIVYDMCTMRWMYEYYGTSHELREANNCTDFRDPKQCEGYYAAYDAAQKIADEKGVFSQWDYHSKLFDYLSLSIDDALLSDDILTRALGLIDRRLGKRRLKTYQIRDGEHPLVKYMLELRLKAEGS